MRALTKLKERKDDFDMVLLETTGLADPAPIIATFTQNWTINNNFRIDGVISLVDAKNITTHINEVGSALLFSARPADWHHAELSLRTAPRHRLMLTLVLRLRNRAQRQGHDCPDPAQALPHPPSPSPGPP